MGKNLVVGLLQLISYFSSFEAWKGVCQVSEVESACVTRAKITASAKVSQDFTFSGTTRHIGVVRGGSGSNLHSLTGNDAPN